MLHIDIFGRNICLCCILCKIRNPCKNVSLNVLSGIYLLIEVMFGQKMLAFSHRQTFDEILHKMKTLSFFIAILFLMISFSYLTIAETFQSLHYTLFRTLSLKTKKKMVTRNMSIICQRKHALKKNIDEISRTPQSKTLVSFWFLVSQLLLLLGKIMFWPPTSKKLFTHHFYFE